MKSPITIAGAVLLAIAGIASAQTPDPTAESYIWTAKSGRPALDRRFIEYPAVPKSINISLNTLISEVPSRSVSGMSVPGSMTSIRSPTWTLCGSSARARHLAHTRIWRRMRRNSRLVS